MAITAMSCGVAGVDTHMKAMGVVGNNIANVNTYGFKSSSAAFTDVMYQTLSSASAPGAAMGGSNPVQIGFGSKLGTVSVNAEKGDQTATGKQSDVYIDGEGYLILADNVTPGAADGNGNIIPKANSYTYSRVGELEFDSQGNLVDKISGKYVCGVNNQVTGDETGTATYTKTSTMTPGATTSPAPIHYDPTTGGAKNTFKEIAFAGDGTITAKNADGAVVTIGKIELAHFPNPAGLSQRGGSLMDKSDNSGAPTCDFAGSSGTGSLVPGALESSNVDLATELSNMIVFERGLQANSKIISVSDEMLQTLVEMKR